MRTAANLGTLRERSLPRFALRRGEAAASLGISPSLFGDWVAKGLVPEGRKINGVILWGVEEIHNAWLRMNEDEQPAADEAENPFDQMVV
ncbi:DNA-binding protein [Rhizobium sp. VS19-DR104.2]|uniref:DNA-binding protein n=1 Tax=unclassified Rhizobium TaxID=2613769 RepID=UPI001CC385C9|nr:MULTISPECIES: DNA-binding protein [unclassified Rhizobium]MBZ5761779.1 DNA-binding protein [Rhizobium sp. VS19-DR96]MBZ5768027.1 DNA-binding protein [Rhizobium sp. VS19-DR129.2]MBZ5775375.1 DNA-binding protein [Rhizobium sp. VS19-DRK62.2]MBZ5786658.1 DNA-binding protein [Rhizobium sp. VS19-DR121]MBZ5803814.1 DNA-binding protein [Rhizobium sp. VS19-DR181]